MARSQKSLIIGFGAIAFVEETDRCHLATRS